MAHNIILTCSYDNKQPEINLGVYGHYRG